MGRSAFGSDMRASDGIIVTFDRDGHRYQQCFHEVIHTSGGSGRSGKGRKARRSGGAYLQQAADHADHFGAKIVYISSPTTIMRDLAGAHGPQTPEKLMLSKIGRQDLLLADRLQPGDARANIKQVMMRRPSRDMSSRG